MVAQSEQPAAVSRLAVWRQLTGRPPRWAANAPLAFIDQYVSNLRQYRGIAIDVGDQDGLRTDTDKLHDVLASYSIAHEFEIYSGTHTSNVAIRFQDHVIPFFSRTLAVDQKRQQQGSRP